MCFSFEADVVAAVALTPVGIATLWAAKKPRQYAIASIPLFFAAHQGVEAFVWLWADGNASDFVGKFAINLYLIMAQMILPVMVPLAVMAIEPDRRRRIYMAISAFGGLVLAVKFGSILINGSATAYPLDHVMVYKTTTDVPDIGGLIYVNATVFTTIAATGTYLRLFGVANAIGISFAGWMRYDAVTSIWCIYAALISFLIFMHLRLDAAGKEWPGQPDSPNDATDPRGDKVSSSA
ncbi:MAG: hypothetical protein Q7T55_20780 [Solirubrobacteraceae bacterium]|nr:hypothetical protein [Solirubrobacteraceae bacterium]